jgi:hypothetical protein
MEFFTSSARTLALAGLALGLCSISAAKATSVEERLTRLNQSMDLCIITASRPGFPYYDRPEAEQACQQTKVLLQRFGREANRNRNLGCSSRIAGLHFDVWMIQFLGGKRMQAAVDQNMKQLARNCFNMDS